MRLNIIPSKHTVKLENGMYQLTMKGSIIINYTPEGEYDLISKELVDQYVNNIDLSKLKATVSKGTFPSVKGDFLKDGKDEYQLVNSSKLTNGHMSFSVNKKGFASNSVAKIPANLWGEVDYNRIDKSTVPNTPEGLGIKDAITLDGKGSTNEGFQYEESGTRADAPATFLKATNFFKDKVKYDVGDVILVESSHDMYNTDFLPLDNSEISKEDYPKLYKAVGSVYGNDFSYVRDILFRHRGTPWKKNENFPKLSGYDNDNTIIYEDVTGDLVPDVTFPAIGGYAAFIIKNRIYIVGGFYGDRSKPLNTVYYTTINKENGNLTQFKRIGDFPEKRVFSKAILINGIPHIIGGISDVSVNGNNPPIYKANLDEEGNILDWVKCKNNIKVSRSGFNCYTLGNRLYVSGGIGFTGVKNGNKYNYVEQESREWCMIDGSGELGEFHIEKSTFFRENFSALWGTGNSIGSVSMGDKFNKCLVRNRSLYNITNRLKFTDSAKYYSNDIFRGEDFFINSYIRSGRSGVPLSYGEIYFYAGSDSLNDKYKANIDQLGMFIHGRTSSGGITHNHGSVVEPDPRSRRYFEVVGWGNYIYLIGGCLKDCVDNIDNYTNLPIIRYKNFSYDGDFSEITKVSVSDTHFTLPKIDPMTFNGVSYDYYIYAGPKG